MDIGYHKLKQIPKQKNHDHSNGPFRFLIKVKTCFNEERNRCLSTDLTEIVNSHAFGQLDLYTTRMHADHRLSS